MDAHAVFTCYSHAFFNALSQMLSIGYGCFTHSMSHWGARPDRQIS